MVTGAFNERVHATSSAGSEEILSLPFSQTQSSQNHRMFRVGRDLCVSPSPTPLPKQGQPEQAAQDHIQAGLECLQITFNLTWPLQHTFDIFLSIISNYIDGISQLMHL